MAGKAAEGKPLVLDEEGRLYLRRYWEYEESLAAQILKRCGGPGAITKTGLDLQEQAVEMALVRRFIVISGGPGTGKTTTVLKILERFLGEPGGEKLRIALAAPTGKAAARLQETLQAGATGPLQERLPPSASTLHRLLGPRHGSAYFRHHAGNPLPVDLVIVDEASMVPLTLMAKLLEALPQKARLILLGDRDQLASVEPGSVLGDIAEAAGEPGSPLHGSLVALRKNYRFGNESNIFALSEAVRQGQAEEALKILETGEKPDLSSQAVPAQADFPERLRPKILEGYAPYLQAAIPRRR